MVRLLDAKIKHGVQAMAESNECDLQMSNLADLASIHAKGNTCGKEPHTSKLFLMSGVGY